MRTVLVTGAGRGIGEAVARRLAGDGWKVFAGVRDGSSGERLGAWGERITPVELDITNEGDVEALTQHLPDRLDAVVNNAGIGVLGPLEAVSIEDLRRQFEVNVVGQVAVTQAVLPLLRTAKGRIVFISSTGGRTAIPMEGAYCASKFALEGVADALRLELRPWQIEVSVVEPGPTNTETWRGLDKMIDDIDARMAPAHRELYNRHTTGLRTVASRLQALAVPPDAVARVVEHALTTRRPRARYLAGTPAHIMIAMNKVLPTRIADAVGARISGID